MKIQDQTKISMGAFVLLILTVAGCSNCQKIHFLKFDKRPPQIHITNQIDECRYSVNLHLTLNGTFVAADGILTFNDGKFVIDIPQFQVEELALFDFHRQNGEEYQAIEESGPPSNSRFVVNCKIDSIYRRNDGDLVHTFRLINTFIEGNATGDILFFATPSKGIIGSYISVTLPNDGSDYEAIFGPGEKYLDPRGDYLVDVIDYSKKSRVRIL